MPPSPTHTGDFRCTSAPRWPPPTLSLLAACQSAPPAATAAGPCRRAPAWQQGRLPEQAGSTLAPVAGKLTATPASDIPLQNFKLPPASRPRSGPPACPAPARWRAPTTARSTSAPAASAASTSSPTTAARAPAASSSTSWCSPRGVAYANGALYVMAIDKVLRFDGIATNPACAAGGHDGRLPAAEGTAPQLEVHRLRPRRQALRALRRAVQHLRAGPGIRADPPLQRRRQRHGSDRPRRAQHAGLRLAPRDEGDVVHRPRPRLDGRRRPGRRAEPHEQGGAELRLPVLPRQWHHRPRLSRRPAPATT